MHVLAYRVNKVKLRVPHAILYSDLHSVVLWFMSFKGRFFHLVEMQSIVENNYRLE